MKDIRKIFSSLKPLELFDVVTKGYCDHHLPEIKQQIIELKGYHYLENWYKKNKIDVLEMYLSEGVFKLYTTPEEAKSLEKIFKSWNVFYIVNTEWFDEKTLKFMIMWDNFGFEKLYIEWIRDKKINQIIK